MIRRVMLDIETLGTVPGSVVRSMGAVEFTGGVIGRTFFERIDVKSSQDVGLGGMDWATVQWWLGQSTAARAEMACTDTDVHLQIALSSLSRFMDSLKPTGDEALEVWGYGPSFDCGLVAAAYRVCGRELPWRYSRERCLRTLAALRPDIQMVRRGEHHCALDDARDQAGWAIRLLEALGCADWEGAEDVRDRQVVCLRLSRKASALPTDDLEALAAAGDLRDEGEHVVVPDGEPFPRGGLLATAPTYPGSKVESREVNNLPESSALGAEARGEQMNDQGQARSEAELPAPTC